MNLGWWTLVVAVIGIIFGANSFLPRDFIAGGRRWSGGFDGAQYFFYGLVFELAALIMLIVWLATT